MCSTFLQVPLQNRSSKPFLLGDASSLSVSTPRLFIKCEKQSRLEIVEEFVTLNDAPSLHLTLPVLEIELAENAELDHHYVQLTGSAAYHLKTTLVKQATQSRYRFVESSVGGRLTRHDLNIDQVESLFQSESGRF